jgi:type II secretory pathway pseudopilin PulG
MAANSQRPSRLIVLADLMAGQRTAYSLVELIVVVLILGALTFIAVPRLNFAALYHKQAHTVAKRIVTDLRRTRTLAIVNAAKHQASFTLSISGLNYKITDDYNGATVDSQALPQQVHCAGDSNNFTFGPLGNLTSSGKQLDVFADEGRKYIITITSATGMVGCTGG